MARKRKIGKVVKVNAPTARIRVDRMHRHPLYDKAYQVSRNILAHIPAELTLNIGDFVEIEENRPISKRKAWVVLKVAEAAKETEL
ncbi:mitochondrial small ribosomal subunit protein uS17m [Candidatus Berkelbacteria bacterium]|nr:mitochondrial small ribosomal subunit protein uS17m [Candidatus Berkelbacteria bacterium]